MTVSFVSTLFWNRNSHKKIFQILLLKTKQAMNTNEYSFDVINHIFSAKMAVKDAQEFFQGCKIYCYANFFCYAIVFGPNFKEGQKFSNCAPPCHPPWKKASMFKQFILILLCATSVFTICLDLHPVIFPNGNCLQH